MSTSFYRAFEDRYRGSRESIAKRLEAYLPFIYPLRALYSGAPVLDLGCGRGEWLELMNSEGFSAWGVDLDDGMLEACRVLELAAKRGDALSALADLADNSQAVVSAFHLVEHVPFADVHTLVNEALRVLKPAGLLIMETPNAENLVVGTNNFFLDPTHEKPIPHLLLSFLTEFAGFGRTKVVRLQEDSALHSLQHLSLMHVLGGVSPDYAVVAQKTATPEQLTAFDASFDCSYGMSLEHLAQHYDKQLQERYDEQLRECCAQLEERFQRPLTQLAAERDEALARVQALTSSSSWRITAPLRWSIRTMRGAPAALKRAPRRAVGAGMQFLLARPALFRALNTALKRSPRLYAALKSISHNHGMTASSASLTPDSAVPAHLDSLSVEARQVYLDLEKAMDQKDRG